MEKNATKPIVDTERLFIEARHWKSDLDFYHKESRFLSDLVGHHFLPILQSEPSSLVKKMAFDLKELERKRAIVSISIDKHLIHLEDQITMPETMNPKVGLDEHLRIQEKINAYIVASRAIKEEVFGILKHVRATEKVQDLLDA